MVIEYVLLMVSVLLIGLKFLVAAPREAFKNSGPLLGMRIEKQLKIGEGFVPATEERPAWKDQ